jgi:hypothetical protein
MRYFFDIRDDDSFARDDIGVDLRDDVVARSQATLALTEMARDYLPSDGDHRNLKIEVRTEDGPRFDVTLDFDLEDRTGSAPQSARPKRWSE